MDDAVSNIENPKLDDFIEAWLSGAVCLHPTDTIPGLSYNPDSQEASKQFFAMKQRDPDKPSICLVASAEVAFSYWSELPGLWRDKLKSFWPPGLSIIWKASGLCSPELTNRSGELALRVPTWSKPDLWMHSVLKKLSVPFPTSSVNIAGEKAADTWHEALNVLRSMQSEAYIPNLPANIGFEGEPLGHKYLPSTLIRITNDEKPTDKSMSYHENSLTCRYQIIREGAFERKRINQWLNN